MSYILDALKKSEAERSGSNSGDKKSPSKQARLDSSALHSSASTSQGSNAAILIVILLVILLIGLVATLLYTQSLKTSSSDERQVVIKNVPTSVPLPLDNASSITNLSNAVTEARLVLPSSPATVDVAVADGTLTSKKLTNNKQDRSELENSNLANENEITPPSSTPFATLEQIPTLNITGHTYSTIKDKRQVVMNGEVWREGAVIIEDVKLQEITQGGIILDVAGWPVVIGRSQGWKAIKSSD